MLCFLFFIFLIFHWRGHKEKVLRWSEKCPAADMQGVREAEALWNQRLLTTNRGTLAHSLSRKPPTPHPFHTLHIPPPHRLTVPSSCQTPEGDVEWLEMQKRRCKAAGKTHTNELLKTRTASVKVTGILINALSLGGNKPVRLKTVLQKHLFTFFNNFFLNFMVNLLCVCDISDMEGCRKSTVLAQLLWRTLNPPLAPLCQRFLMFCFCFFFLPPLLSPSS